MKHAGPAALEALSELLQEIRNLPGLVEKKPGIFYVKVSAYLHFHEDKAGLFADVKLSGQAFSRFQVNTPQEQKSFLRRLKQSRSLTA